MVKAKLRKYEPDGEGGMAGEDEVLHPQTAVPTHPTTPHAPSNTRPTAMSWLSLLAVPMCIPPPPAQEEGTEDLGAQVASMERELEDARCHAERAVAQMQERDALRLRGPQRLQPVEGIEGIDGRWPRTGRPRTSEAGAGRDRALAVRPAPARGGWQGLRDPARGAVAGLVGALLV